MEDKNHEEAFTGAEPEIGHLRIFACLVYIHVPEEIRTKLELSRENGVCGVQRDLKGLQDLNSSTMEDSVESRC